VLLKKMNVQFFEVADNVPKYYSLEKQVAINISIPRTMCSLF